MFRSNVGSKFLYFVGIFYIGNVTISAIPSKFKHVLMTVDNLMR